MNFTKHALLSQWKGTSYYQQTTPSRRNYTLYGKHSVKDTPNDQRFAISMERIPSLLTRKNCVVSPIP